MLGWAYFVGMARFALEGNYRASWQIRRNIRVARKNWRKGITLLLYMIALSIIYGIVREIVAGIFGGIMDPEFAGGDNRFDHHLLCVQPDAALFRPSLITQYAAEIEIRSSRYDPDRDKSKVGLTPNRLRYRRTCGRRGHP